MTFIDAFEVPRAADAEFVAAWRASHADRPALAAAALHRALRDDVALRFVAIGRVESPDAGRAGPADLEPPHHGPPFPAHPGRYETVAEDGTPDGAGGVLLINPFEVSPGDDERFLDGWRRVRDLVAAEHGYLGTRLHRSVEPAAFRFVDLARWSSPLMFARALQRPEIGAAAAAVPFPSHPALYQVVE